VTSSRHVAGGRSAVRVPAGITYLGDRATNRTLLCRASHSWGMGRASGSHIEGRSGDARFTRAIGVRRGHPDNARNAHIARAHDRLASAAVRKEWIQRVWGRLQAPSIRILSVGVLGESHGTHAAGTHYVRIACESLDACEHAEVRLGDYSATTDEEWASGWKVEDGWLTIRVFDPVPLQPADANR
jgi:hypothetical protein